MFTINHFTVTVKDHDYTCETKILMILKKSKPLPMFTFSKPSSYFHIMYPAWTFWTGGPVSGHKYHI